MLSCDGRRMGDDPIADPSHEASHEASGADLRAMVEAQSAQMEAQSAQMEAQSAQVAQLIAHVTAQGAELASLRAWKAKFEAQPGAPALVPSIAAQASGQVQGRPDAEGPNFRQPTLA